MPNCSSKPSAVRPSGGTITPALLISRSSVARPSPRRTRAPRRGSARSSRRTSVGAGHRGRGGAALLDVADGEHDARAGAGERAGGGAADAAVGAGDDRACGRSGRAGRRGSQVVIGNNVDMTYKDVNVYIDALRCGRTMSRAALPPREPARRAARGGAERTVRERGRRRRSRCASWRARSASATARRAGTSPTARRCSTPSPRKASRGSAETCAPPSRGRARTSRSVCTRSPRAYVRFATRDAALLELMFASKHRESSGRVARGGRPRVLRRARR